MRFAWMNRPFGGDSDRLSEYKLMGEADMHRFGNFTQSENISLAARRSWRWHRVTMMVLVVAVAGLSRAFAQDQPARPAYRPLVKKKQTERAEELRVQSITDDVRKEYRLDPFYKKAVVIDGIPIIGSGNVSDYAFLECAWIVDHMLEGQDRIKRALVENKVRIGIIAATEYTMDIPENQRPRMIARGAYHDRRSRGLGGYTLTTCGEENLLSLHGDPYRQENIAIHEFAHTIASNLRRADRAWWDRLDKLYRQAMDEGLWASSYAATNVQEYWAEGTQSWFDCNTPRNDGRVHNGIWNRERLKEYDPRLAEFLKETFGDRPWRYTKTVIRSPEQLAHLQGLDRDEMPTFSFEKSPRVQADRKGGRGQTDRNQTNAGATTKDLAGEAAAVQLTFAGLPQENGTARLEHFRIDDEYSNAHTVWQRMGSPQKPTPEQIGELEEAGRLARLNTSGTAAIESGQTTIRFQLPRQGVSLVMLHLRHVDD